MSGSYQNLYMLYNSLQGQINNIDSGAGTLQEVVNNGNGINNAEGNINTIQFTDIVLSPNTTATLSAGEIKIEQPALGAGAGSNSTLRKDSYIVAQLPVGGGNATTLSTIEADSIKTETSAGSAEMTASDITISGSSNFYGTGDNVMSGFGAVIDYTKTDIATERQTLETLPDNLSIKYYTDTFDIGVPANTASINKDTISLQHQYLDGFSILTDEMTLTPTQLTLTSVNTSLDILADQAGLITSITATGVPLEIRAPQIMIGHLSTTEITIGYKTDEFDFTNTDIHGQVNFDLPPHSVSPILGNDLATKGYVDTLIGNYGSNGLALYFNITDADPNPIITYPTFGVLSSLLAPVDATPPADYYTLQTTALGTDTRIAVFTTPVGSPNLLTIPAGLWNMLVYGYASGSGGQLYYHFHLLELKSDLTTSLIAVSGYSSDVNSTSSTDPDTYHASLAIVEPYTMDSLDSRLIIEIYSTGTGMGGSVKLNTLFGGIYYSFVSTSLSGGTSLLTADNNWTGTNTYDLLSYFTTGISSTKLETTSIDAITPITSLIIGNSGSTLLLKGGSSNTISVDSAVNMSVKDQTAGSNNGYVANTKYVDTAISALSLVYQTIAGMSAYLTTASASSTYQTLAGMSSYLTTASASSTYQTLAGMSAYLTTATASSTYQTLAGMSAYLTTATALATYLTIATASSTYQTIAGMSAYLTTATASATYATIASLANYGAKATTNTWALLQTFTAGISTYSITGAVAGTAVALFNTTTGVIDFGSSGQINVGNYRFDGGSLGRGTAGGGISFGDTQTTGTMDLGTNAGRSGAIGIGANSCAVNVGGILNANQGLVLGGTSFITTAGGAAFPSATQIGGEVIGSQITPVPTLTNNNWWSVGSIGLTPGVWIIYGVIGITTLQGTTEFISALGTSLRTGGTGSTGAFDIYLISNFVNTNTQQYLSVSGILRTSASPTAYMTVRANWVTTAPTVTTTNFYLKAFKLA